MNKQEKQRIFKDSFEMLDWCFDVMLERVGEHWVVRLSMMGDIVWKDFHGDTIKQHQDMFEDVCINLKEALLAAEKQFISNSKEMKWLRIVKIKDGVKFTKKLSHEQ